MKIIVGGTRTFSDYALLKKKLDKLTEKLDRKNLYVVHGGAPGADSLASRWAFERRIGGEIVFHANWKKYKPKGVGKNPAGHIRNSEMVEKSGAKKAVFFWDGKSPGTKDCIARCKKAGMEVRVYEYGED